MKSEILELHELKLERVPFEEQVNTNKKNIEQMNISLERYQIKQEKTISFLRQAEKALEESIDKECAIKNELQTMETERIRLVERESNLTNQLRTTLQNMLNLNIHKQSFERQKRSRRLINDMIKLFPGVRGKLIDLCRPAHKRFEDALGILLGKNANSVVVERASVAGDCINFLKNQRAPPMTFIPIDSISSKPIPEMVKSLFTHSNPSIRNGLKMAIDVIHMETKDLYPAFMYAIGSAIICDTLDLARKVCYEMKVKTKGRGFFLFIIAVTIDGSVIHKNGYLSGGSISTIVSSSDGDENNHWQISEYDKLNVQKEELMIELSNVQSELNNIKDKNALMLKLYEVEKYAQSCRAEMVFASELTIFRKIYQTKTKFSKGI